METYDANRVAVGRHAARVRAALKAYGMRRCSVRLVNYQCEPGDARLDWYGLFWRWFRALWTARREGAEFLFEDFCARVDALRGAHDAPGADYRTLLARCEREHSEIISAVLGGADAARIRKEVVESIVESRRLLTVLTKLEGRREAA